MNEHVRKYTNEIAKLSPTQMTNLSTRVYSDHNQGFRVVSVSASGKEKRVTVQLKSGIKKVYTV